MRQYVGFSINSGDFMIPILNVREIINMPAITVLPQLPSYIKGIANLRGAIIPIVDLKRILDNSYDEGTGGIVIIITSGKIIFGIIIDKITGVLNVDENKIELPENFCRNNMDLVEGVAKLDDRLVVLLDTKKILPLDDMSLLEDTILDIRETNGGDQVEVTREIDTIGGKVTTVELHNAKEFINRNYGKNDVREKIFEMVLEFMEALAANDYHKAETIISRLLKEKDNELFSSIGKITRRLHDSIEDFKGSLENGLQKLSSTDVPDAVDNLQFVISKTEDAANRTMGIIERYFEESSEFTKHINNIKDNNEDVEYIRTFKDSLDADMTAILTAQQFQDLTGQTIRKVIDLVNNIEAELLKLITRFGMQTKTGPDEAVVAAAADLAKAERPAEKINQSDVETLLSEFGF
ncbi:MAG: protein phosphatase CheZ [Nitrospirota bacterium]|nr:protein phosphatase CheZ [Nitrospirota bacterium]